MNLLEDISVIWLGMIKQNDLHLQVSGNSFTGPSLEANPQLPTSGKLTLCSAFVSAAEVLPFLQLCLGKQAQAVWLLSINCLDLGFLRTQEATAFDRVAKDEAYATRKAQGVGKPKGTLSGERSTAFHLTERCACSGGRGSR